MFDFDVVTGPSSLSPAAKPATQPPDRRAAPSKENAPSEKTPVSAGSDASR